MSPLSLRTCEGGVLLKVSARPGASKSAIQGVHGDTLKVAVHAPPEKGKANKELIAFLAKQLGVRRAQVSLRAGHTSRTKTLRVEGLDVEALRERLSPFFGA